MLPLEQESLRQRIHSVSNGNPLDRQIGVLNLKQEIRSKILFSDGQLPANNQTIVSFNRDAKRLAEMRARRSSALALKRILDVPDDGRETTIDDLAAMINSLHAILPISDNNFKKVNPEKYGLNDNDLGKLLHLTGLISLPDEEDKNNNLVKNLYRGFFEYYLWKFNKRNELPELTQNLLYTSLLDRIPPLLLNFHLYTLPQAWIDFYNKEELSGKPVSSDTWQRFFTEQTRRNVTANMGLDISKLNSTSSNEYSKWRKEYMQSANLLGIKLEAGGESEVKLSVPEMDSFKKYLVHNLVQMMSDRNAERIILGVSGDLDSSAMLAFLAEIIREHRLPYKITAFYLKKEQHNTRFNRIKQLIQYANRELEEPVVEFKVFDMQFVYHQLILALRSTQNGFTGPNPEYIRNALLLTVEGIRSEVDKKTQHGTNNQISRKRREYGMGDKDPRISKLAKSLRGLSDDNFPDVFESLTESYGEALPEGQLVDFIAGLLEEEESTDLSRILEAIDTNEQGNVIHELLLTIRGHLCRQNNMPLTVSGQNMTELSIGNVGTADSFVAWLPFGYFLKTHIRELFREYLNNSGGNLDADEWEKRPLKDLVPYFPDGMSVSQKNNMTVLCRTPVFIDEFTKVEVDYLKSAIPQDVWENIRKENGHHLRMDGQVQWHIDPFIHYFLIRGLSEKSYRELVKMFPNRDTDIQLAAFLMSGSRENRQKDIFLHQTSRNNLNCSL